MKEIVGWIIPTILVFGFIGLLESVMIFEKHGENISLLPSKKQIVQK